MYALEPEPEQRNRGRRMIVGGFVAVGLIGGFFVAAQCVEPMRRLLPEVVQLAVVDEPPPRLDELPPPPPPPPPPPKAAPPKREPPAVKAPQQQKAEQQPSDPQVGLDGSSFGNGEGGIAFRQGNTQMGDPNVPVKQVEQMPKEPPPMLEPARALNPETPRYPERARRLNIEGFVLLEADIDARGQLVDVRVREGCDPSLDEVAVATVRRWKFKPASLAGREVASTHLIRIRFALT